MARYLRGGNQDKWHTIGLSVMATQASAITFLSTPGQAYQDGMRFIQFYFGLPLAMIALSIVFLPRYFNLHVFTAYEFLESRFDLKTRQLAAFCSCFSAVFRPASPFTRPPSSCRPCSAGRCG
jgi:SSS family solute:Na+ symporter